MGANVCCPQLEIVPCNDTPEHNHLVCLAWQTEGDLILDNNYIIRHCLRNDGSYTSCPCYPKTG